MMCSQPVQYYELSDCLIYGHINFNTRAGTIHCNVSFRSYSTPTCESLSISLSASFLRSGLLMYFWLWNIFSRPLRWKSEKTARRSIPRRGFPRRLPRNGKPPGGSSIGPPVCNEGKRETLLMDKTEGPEAAFDKPSRKWLSDYVINNVEDDLTIFT